MRILLISGLYPSESNITYGIFIKRQVEALRRAGHEVTVVANTDSATGQKAALRKYSNLYFRARKAASAGSYDIVLGHFLYPTAIIAHMAAKRARVPYVLMAHGSDVVSILRSKDPVARRARAAVKHADGVITVSQSLRQALLEGPLKRRTPTLIAHVGVDLEQFYPREGARDTLGWASSEKIVLQVANLVVVKGPDVLLDAVEPLLDEGSVDKLVYVGDGELREMYQAAVHAAGKMDRIIFTGRLTGGEVATYMTAANVLVLSSRSEGLPTVLLEALACGTPVISTLVGGVPEILPDAPCGYGVVPEDPDKLRHVIEQALAVPDSAKRAEACKAFVEGESTDAMAAEVTDFLRLVVASSQN